jgi:DNA-damage-inducible protein J
MSIQVSTRIDEKTKEDFERVCGNMGLSVSTAFNIFIRAVINSRGIPFELSEQSTGKQEYIKSSNK